MINTNQVIQPKTKTSGVVGVTGVIFDFEIHQICAERLVLRGDGLLLQPY